MIIRDHKLVDVPFRATPNMSGKIVPSYLVVHYTATINGPATIAALCSERLKASAHLLVDFDGTVTQLVPFDRKAWHAGASELHGRVGCNSFTIGIEIVNPGPLKPKDDGFVDVYGRPWHGGVFYGNHKNGGPYAHWATYTTEQMLKLAEVGRLLVAEYGLKDVVGHDDISPGRKIDPGPAFEMDEYRKAIFDPAEEPRKVRVLRGESLIASAEIPRAASVNWDAETDTLRVEET